MSQLFFTADCHFGHSNILKYCGRPFRDADHMNDALIRNWNSRVRQEDTVIHVGDFCCYGAERGIAGVKKRAEDWEALLNGTIIHIAGNHDKNNHCRAHLQSAIVNLGVRKALVRHHPFVDRNGMLVTDAPPDCPVIVCGHVHEQWKIKWSSDGILVVNVGVDQHNFHPVLKHELIGMIEKEIAAHGKR